MLKVVEENNSKEVKFGTLKPLTVFRYKGNIYIPTRGHAGRREALNITTGSIQYLDFDTKVKIIEAELHIKG